MHHDYVLLTSHLGADLTPLVGSMNTHPEISVTMKTIVYSTPPELMFLQQACEQIKKARIYVGPTLYNHTLRGLSLYEQCKFIYFFDDPEITISDLVRTFKPTDALNHYGFRLQRMAQMAKQTKNAMFITRKDLAGCAEKLSEFLHLKQPLSIFVGPREEIEMHETAHQGKSVYERYLAKMSAIFNPE